ncbi:hypothetical protein MLD38_002343 [Melastoma candidum]|uniref:Uncharacterized protein n=1 Tax=Melastoma candidum TaxID=119954 RepID=A0ACB9S246_9MYRT|nr:hypothetical protein MLD38_002343 [Melastoma candidum]
MEGDLMVLGVWASPFVRRVQMVLDLKGIEYEYREDNDLMNKSPLLLKLNPVHKKVPVLVHHGKPIPESQVIIEYIDEKWTDKPILPLDPYDRAMARFWATYIDEKCLPAFWKAAWVSPPGEEREKACEEAYEVFGKLEAHLKEGDKKFFGGDDIGYVDIVANFLLYWFVLIGEEVTGVRILTEERFPALWECLENFKGSPIAARHLPDKDKLLSFYKSRLAATSSS